MSLNDLANLGQFIGAVGVVISLVYLALQVRQNTAHLLNSTKAMEVSALLAARTLATNFSAQLLSSQSLTRVFRLGIGKSEDLKPDDRIRFDLLMADYFHSQETLFLLHQGGVLGDAQWSPLRTRMALMLRTPGARQWWGAQQSSFGAGFRQFVNSELLRG